MPDQPVALSSEALARLREVAKPDSFVPLGYQDDMKELISLGLISGRNYNWGFAFAPIRIAVITDAGRAYLGQHSESKADRG